MTCDARCWGTWNSGGISYVGKTCGHDAPQAATTAASPRDPLRAAITDHDYVFVSDNMDPLGQFCGYGAEAGDRCGRPILEHARRWTR